jgi:hypothetical protein
VLSSGPNDLIEKLFLFSCSPSPNRSAKEGLEAGIYLSEFSIVFPLFFPLTFTLTRWDEPDWPSHDWPPYDLPPRGIGGVGQSGKYRA